MHINNAHRGHSHMEPTPKTRPETVVVSIQEAVQDPCEHGDVGFQGIGGGISFHRPKQQTDGVSGWRRLQQTTCLPRVICMHVNRVETPRPTRRPSGHNSNDTNNGRHVDRYAVYGCTVKPVPCQRKNQYCEGATCLFTEQICVLEILINTSMDLW